MNLYVNHDYYPAAISPAIAALLGLGCGWVWSVVRPRWLVAALPCVAVLLAWGTLSSDEATGCESTAATTILR